METFSLTNTIGHTPIVRLGNLFPHQKVFAKLEGQNPGGSIKDRAASFMIQQALQDGELDQSKNILEATSGNMGIALTMIGRSLNIPITIIMSAGMSDERKQMIRNLGASLILTDPNQGTFGAIQKAKSLVAQSPEKYWFSNQFENQNNPLAYEHSLGPEILEQFPEVDVVVGGIGTSGTMVGLGRFFRKNAPHIRTYAVIPPAGFQIQGIQNPKEDFCPGILDTSLFQQEISVSKEDAFTTTREIAKTEGLFVGLSSGACVAALHKKKVSDKNILLIFPDRGEKYLSTGVFS